MDAEKVALAADDDTTHYDITIPPEDTTVVPDDQTLLLDPSKKKKIREIKAACNRRDILELRKLADNPGGFLSDEARKLACEFQNTYT